MSAAENKAVFLSYASQDAEAAKRICDALRAAGVEVWFDQSELRGGDAWDQKIRGQIASCALFVPVVSTNTQARREGYFRIEWKLAAQRTHAMADGTPFLVPVVIDDTRDTNALVPAEFKAVQWMRLPEGEGAEKFGERVRSLLAGDVAQASRLPAEKNAGGTPALRPRPRLAGWVWVAVIAALIVLPIWRPWQSAPVPAEGKTAVAATPAVKLSEARELAAKARALIDKPNAARAELAAAEELCKKAAGLDSTDAEVLATWSQVCTWLVFHYFDALPERREAARFKAAQALQLAPDSYEARFAQACYLVRGGGGATTGPEGEQADGLLQALLREKPDEPRALLALGVWQGRSDRLPEARATFERLAKKPAFAATAWGELGWVEMFAANYAAAEAAVDRANELQPLWRNLVLKTLLAVEWRGDLDFAVAIQKRLPESVRPEDVGVFVAVYLSYLRHEPEQMLRALDATPRDWLNTGGYVGPTAVWAALAHEQLGAKDRADDQWKLALKRIERRLNERPDRDVQMLEAYVLAALGQRADAEKILGLVRNASELERLPWLRRNRYVVTKLRLGQTEAALEYLENDSRLTAAMLRHEPTFEPLRALPRFQSLQARIAADPSRSPRDKAAAKGTTQ